MFYPQSLYSGLVDYWPLNEASGDAYGLCAGNQLVDTNTVTQNPGIVTYARQFTKTNTEYFTKASNANLQTGDIDFTFTGWFYLNSKPAEVIFAFSKDGAVAGQREYGLYWHNVTDRFGFQVFRATDVPKAAVANSLGAPSTATWYFLSAWHDATNDTVNIEANASGNIDSVATTGALQAAAGGVFDIGGYRTGTNTWDGRICEIGYWKRVLTPAERAWLYNGGLGRTYPFDGRPSAIDPQNGIPGVLVG